MTGLIDQFGIIRLGSESNGFIALASVPQWAALSSASEVEDAVVATTLVRRTERLCRLDRRGQIICRLADLLKAIQSMGAKLEPISTSDDYIPAR